MDQGFLKKILIILTIVVFIVCCAILTNQSITTKRNFSGEQKDTSTQEQVNEINRLTKELFSQKVKFEQEHLALEIKDALESKAVAEKEALLQEKDELQRKGEEEKEILKNEKEKLLEKIEEKTKMEEENKILLEKKTELLKKLEAEKDEQVKKLEEKTALLTKKDELLNIAEEEKNSLLSQREHLEKKLAGQEVTTVNPLPTCGNEKLVGQTFMDMSRVKDIQMLEETLSKVTNPDKGFVELGGTFKPKGCTAKAKTAILVPYRNRAEQLKIFLRYMHPFLQRQQLHYRIFLIEHLGDDKFNRATLLNIGYKESLKFEEFDCFVLSDIDFLPEDDHNSYGCNTSPKHLIAAADRFNNALPYEGFFGGVSSFTRKHFELINGFSNLFWGWGGEDDDLYGRIKNKGLELHRPAVKTGSYRSITLDHNRSGKFDDYRMKTLQTTAARQDVDGINTLKYDLKEVKEEKLYTLVQVRLTREMYKYLLTNCLNQRL